MSTITIKIGIFLVIYDSNDKYVESHRLGFDFIEFPPHPNLENNYDECIVIKQDFRKNPEILFHFL